MAPEATRRSVLALLGTTAAGTLAGCAALEDHPALLVFNHRDGPVTAAVSIRRVADDAAVFAATFDLAGGGEAGRQLDLSAGPHRITTDVEGEPEASAEWTPGKEGCCIEVHVRTDGVGHEVRAY